MTHPVSTFDLQRFSHECDILVCWAKRVPVGFVNLQKVSHVLAHELRPGPEYFVKHVVIFGRTCDETVNTRERKAHNFFKARDFG